MPLLTFNISLKQSVLIHRLKISCEAVFTHGRSPITFVGLSSLTRSSMDIPENEYQY